MVDPPNKPQRLEAVPVDHAGRVRVMHPDLGRQVLAQTAVRYLRFLHPVRVSHLELPIVNAAALAGRWVPSVPTHPAHVVVSTLDERTNRWRIVKEIDLAPNPDCRGQGLSQDTPIDRMEEHFRRCVDRQVPHRIDLDDIETDCLKGECDREHPVWPSHGECNGGPFNVPFGILNGLAAFGVSSHCITPPPYRHKLTRGTFAPSAPPGMAVDTRNPLEVVYHGRRLSVGFSLVRPMLTRLDWNHVDETEPRGNRLLFSGRPGSNLMPCRQSGPCYITPTGDYVPQVMTGTVEVEDNRVSYRGVETGAGVTLDASFTISADALVIELQQEAHSDVPALEADAWRLAWSMRAGLTGVAAPPVEKEGRNGFVRLPALVAADRGGCLSVTLLEGTGQLHTESYRREEARSIGLVLCDADTHDAPLVVKRGRRRAIFELRPCTLQPAAADDDTPPQDGLRQSWSAGFSAFRPEFGGFSNNAISTNCHVNQYAAFDYAAFTARPKNGPDPMDLVRFSIGRALMDGGGYGYHRELYLDSDPILLSGAGRVIQLTRECDWLHHVGPGIRAATRRVLGNVDQEEGLVTCRTLSGNEGSHRWSSNAMDVIGFGHIDAYVNAWAFRGLKNAAALCTLLDDNSLATQCTDAAEAILHNYTPRLLNPDTGWIAGWRSRDEHLHDYGFLWVNGVACAFGVVDRAVARRALEQLETLREAVFPESGYPGLPLNLQPIAPGDHMLPRLGYRTVPTFEHYTDGALSPIFAGYYIRALSINGLDDAATRLAHQVERGFADGRFQGPYGTGREFMTWTGADSGYEGTFGPAFAPLYAIAVARGAVDPPRPEWWLDLSTLDC